MEREEYIESLPTLSGKVEMECSILGCYRTDLVEKEIAVEIIRESYPHNDYICEHCYKNGIY